MSRWEARLTKRARKDVDRPSPKLKEKLRDIFVEVLADDPYAGKRLLGDLAGSYSYRLTFQDRIVYSLDEKRRIVYVERARTHCGE